MAAPRTLAHYVQASGLLGTPASVEVDVFDATDPATLLATIPNADVSRIGSTTTYQTNLANLSVGIGYPTPGSPAERHYVLRWHDDAAGEVWDRVVVAGMVGPLALSGRCERATPVYSEFPVASRGITQGVINAGKPSYVKIDVAPDLDFDNPAFSYYEIYRYDSSGRVLSRTPATAPPAP